MNRNKQIIGIVILFLAVAGAFFLFGRNVDDELSFDKSTSIFDSVVLGEEYLRFVHPEYGFSVEYPKEMDIEMFEESEGGRTIVFSEQSTDLSIPENKKGFQIFISPFEEGSTLTLGRIREDLPDIVIEEPLEVIVGTETGHDTPALIFWSEDPKIGKTREVWFVRGSYLYEITAFAHMDTLLAGMLSTLTFSDIQ